MDYLHCFVEMTHIQILLGKYKKYTSMRNATLMNYEVDGKHYIKK